MNSCRKGKAGERELAAYLTEFGFQAMRGRQFSGGPDSPDVACPALGFHIECKRVERLDLDGACAQAERDAAGQRPWVVFHRRNKSPWRATLDGGTFLKLIRRLNQTLA